MKVVICAGVKTGNIVSTVKRKYTGGDVEILSKVEISQITGLFEQGNYFDRAILLEEGFTANGSLSEDVVRATIQEFLRVIKAKCSNDVTFVWVVTNTTMARLVCEETLDLTGRSITLVRNKAEKLVTSFFVNVISNTLDNIHPDLVFTVKDIRSPGEAVEGFSEAGTRSTLTQVEDVNIGTMVISKQSRHEEGVSLDDLFNIPEDNTDDQVTETEESFHSTDTLQDVFDKLDSDTEMHPSSQETSKQTDTHHDVVETYTDSDTDKPTESQVSENDEIEEVGDPIPETPQLFSDLSDTSADEDTQETPEYESTPSDIVDTPETTRPYEDELQKEPQGGILKHDIVLPEIKEIKSTQVDTPTVQLEEESEMPEQEESVDSYSNLFGIVQEHESSTEPEQETVQEAQEESQEDYTDLFGTADTSTDEQPEIIEEGGESNTSFTDEPQEPSLADLFSETQDTRETTVSDDEEDMSTDDYVSLFTDIPTEENVTPTDDDTLIDYFKPQPEEEQTVSTPDDIDDTPVTEHTQNKTHNEFLDYFTEEPNDSDNLADDEPIKVKRGLFSGLFKPKRSAASTEDTLRDLLDAYRGRGTSIVVTGHHGAGMTTIVANLANIISRLGYTVLVVDMDTRGRGQAAITRSNYDTIHSVDTASSGLRQALNTSYDSLGQFMSVVTPTLHLLSTGLAADILTGDKLAPRTKLSRFANMVRTNYCVTIYDMPMELASDYAADIVLSSEHIVVVSDYSNWGAENLLIDMANIEAEEVETTLFTRGQICLNRVRDTKLKSVLGRITHNTTDYLKNMDKELNKLLGFLPNISFAEMRICGEVPYDTRNDSLWYSNKVFSDITDGWVLYVELLYSIFLKKD